VTATEPVARGKRRDPTFESAVLEATRKVLGEAGFTVATVKEISRRSGVSAYAIYRRWPTRLTLIENAAFSTLAAFSPPRHPASHLARAGTGRPGEATRETAGEP